MSAVSSITIAWPAPAFFDSEKIVRKLPADVHRRLKSADVMRQAEVLLGIKADEWFRLRSTAP